MRDEEGRKQKQQRPADPPFPPCPEYFRLFTLQFELANSPPWDLFFAFPADPGPLGREWYRKANTIWELAHICPFGTPFKVPIATFNAPQIGTAKSVNWVDIGGGGDGGERGDLLLGRGLGIMVVVLFLANSAEWAENNGLRLLDFP